MNGDWIPLSSQAPFPLRMQGKWTSDPDGEVVVSINGRSLAYRGRPIAVGELSTFEEAGTFSVRNDGLDESNAPWGTDTLYLFWFNPGEDILNFHGLCDHATAMRAQPDTKA